MRIEFRSLAAAACVAVAALTTACGSDDKAGPSEPQTVVVPSGVSATATSPTSVTVTWSQVSGATAYEVDRAPSGGAFASVVTGLTSTVYIDNGVQASTQYRYVVRAVSGALKSSNSGEATVTTPAAPVVGPKVATIYGITTSRTLYADTVYTLSGYVKVTNGATLTIQPGTKIIGDTLVNGSSLWITRGAKINAVGTAAAPIVFTSARAEGHRRPGDWGGILVVGNGTINRTANPIFTEGPTGAAENYAGGSNDADNSGTITYARIEFAGYDVSNGGGQELNSLSNYTVGSGTTYDYIESVSGLDDAFEFFGGAVDIRHMFSWESGDDHFDWTEGYHGRGQFLIAVQTTVLDPDPAAGTKSSDPRGFEGDGCEVEKAGCAFTNTPYSVPVWANFTIVGPGQGGFGSAINDGNGAVIRRGAGGTFVNGIIARWPGVAVSVRDAATKALWDADSLYFRNIVLAENGLNTGAVQNYEAAGTNFGHELADSASVWNISEATLANTFVGALPTKTTTVTTANLNLKPAGSAATGGLTSFAAIVTARTANFFGAAMPATAYVGAVDPNGAAWYEGWTAFPRN